MPWILVCVAVMAAFFWYRVCMRLSESADADNTTYRIEIAKLSNTVKETQREKDILIARHNFSMEVAKTGHIKLKDLQRVGILVDDADEYCTPPPIGNIFDPEFWRK